MTPPEDLEAVSKAPGNRRTKLRRNPAELVSDLASLRQVPRESVLEDLYLANLALRERQQL